MQEHGITCKKKDLFKCLPTWKIWLNIHTRYCDPSVTTVASSLSERLCPVQSFAMATEDDYGAANGADLMDGTPRIALELTSRIYKYFRCLGH